MAKKTTEKKSNETSTYHHRHRLHTNTIGFLSHTIYFTYQIESNEALNSHNNKHIEKNVLSRHPIAEINDEKNWKKWIHENMHTETHTDTLEMVSIAIQFVVRDETDG